GALPLSSLLLPSMRPRPPSSTLFPYTTLFRSLRVPDVLPSLGWVVRDCGSVCERCTCIQKLVPKIFVRAAMELVRARFHRVIEVDRKSTRLNSSHDQISYAVFCLKKKRTRRYH